MAGSQAEHNTTSEQALRRRFYLNRGPLDLIIKKLVVNIGSHKKRMPTCLHVITEVDGD